MLIFIWITSMSGCVLISFSLNVTKSNFIIFHTLPKKKLFDVKLKIYDQWLKEKTSIRYLGVLLDNNLNWKSLVIEIGKKIKRNLGVL